MLKMILRGVRAAVRALRRIAAWPFRVLGGMFGPQMVPIEDDYEDGAVDEKAVEIAKDPAVEAYREILAHQTQARCIVAHAADAQCDLRRPAPAPCLPRSIREWLPGLSYSDLRQITDAGTDTVRSHISKGPYITGLPHVTRLPPVALVMPAGLKMPSLEAEPPSEPEPVATLRTA